MDVTGSRREVMLERYIGQSILENRENGEFQEEVEEEEHDNVNKIR